MSRHNESGKAGWLQNWGSKALHGLYNLYIIGTISSVVIAYFVTDKTKVAITQVTILTVAIGAYLSLSLLLLLYFAVSYSRKARYAEVTANLHRVSHDLRDLFMEIQNFRQEIDVSGGNLKPLQEKLRDDVEQRLIRVLTQVALAFGLATSANCRAAIKLVGKIDVNQPDELSNWYVRTLARDINSHADCKEKDAAEEKKHKVSENTDFELLIRKKRTYFLSGNLPEEKDFENSSKGFYEERRSMLRRWPFPYVSVLTLPIKCVDDRSESKIIGFLTIDSAARKCFNERYDVQLGASIADSLYVVIRSYMVVAAILRKEISDAQS